MVSLFISALFFTACSDDQVEDNNGTKQCLFGDEPHPITGLCPEEVLDPVDDEDQGMTSDPVMEDMATTCPVGEVWDAAQQRCFPETSPSLDMAVDAAPDDADMGPQPVDMADWTDATMEERRCMAGVDDDADGLDNDCECLYGTEPYIADTDGDGLSDGEEDVNKDCRPVGESDARTADTDDDGVNDFDEIQNNLDPLVKDSDGDGIPDGIEFFGCTDPTLEDSDGDGIPDGIEDSNRDGEIGACQNRTYDPACAAGESDPCLADTDGDGIADQDETIYRTCRPSDTQNLVQPQLISNMDGDYQLVLETGVTSAPVTSSAGTAINAHVFEDVTHHYTGFVLSMAPPAGATEAFQLSDHVFNQILAIAPYSASSRRSAGRQVTTHDGFKAMVDATVDLPADVAPEQVRDALLAQLSGVSDATHSLMESIPVGAGESSLLKYQVISRSPQEYVVVVTIAPLSKAQDASLETGFRSDDLTGGASVALAMEQIEPDCVSHKVTERAQVDIIIAMDASGSMQDEQEALSNFVTDLTAFLDAANLDWRIGVTSVACNNITQDTSLSADFRALFPAPSGGFFDVNPCSLPIGVPSSGTSNGQLLTTGGGAGFSSDSTQISNRINAVDGTNSEFTLTMGIAAVDRALPRNDADPNKIREDAAIIVIAVTDEEDEHFKSELEFLPTENPTAAERTQLDMATAPFVDYLLKTEVGATVFGLYNVPNSDCDSAAQFASAIHDIVNKTGGTGGSICQSDITTSLQAIASATAGIASGLRLRGAPVAPSVQVTHAQIMTDMEINVPRSREQGFDYDGIVNRLAFYGANPPQTNDRLVIPYLRWSNSIFMCTTAADCPGEQKYKCVDGECR